MEESPPLLWIEWVDSASHGGVWTHKTDLETGSHKIRSVGWLVREDDDALTIVAHEGGDQYSGDMTIPKVAITAQWEIVLK